MSLTSAQRLWLAWLAVAGALAAAVWLLAPVLTPFLTAAVLAYVLHPAVARLAGPRGPLPRLLAVTLVELAAVAALLGLLLLIVPILSRELPQLREQIPLLAVKLNRHIGPWLAEHGLPVNLDADAIKGFVVKYLSSNVEDWLAAALSSARIGGSFVLAIVGNAVLLPVVLFYLLVDWPQLMGRLRSFLPPRHAEAVLGYLRECDAMLGQYLRGQLSVMGLLALYYALALALAGFELALPVGVFTGLAVFVPYLGFGLGAVLALLAGALQFANWYGVLVVLGVYGFGQLLEGFFLTPRLVGERIGLHPIAVIFVLLACGHLLGFVGVLLALPLGALALVALRRLRAAYMASPLYGAGA